jgi:hypothetical protein
VCRVTGTPDAGWLCFGGGVLAHLSPQGCQSCELMLARPTRPRTGSAP